MPPAQKTRKPLLRHLLRGASRRKRCSNAEVRIKTPHFSIKSTSGAINTGASSSSFNSKYDAANRLSKVRILKDGEAASTKFFTNALGQQVFKSEPKPDQYLPEQSQLGAGFIAWLKTNFGWLYAQAQVDASLGSAYMYADGQLPSWAVLGEYDNGSASGAGRTEYLWLPTEDGGAIPIGMFRSGKFFAIHSDHLGTPRLVTDSLNKPVWQWQYSAFGNNKPTGILKPTTSATGVFTNQPMLRATQNPAAFLDLRFPGQMADEETGLFYNYFRTYQPGQGRYTQNDPIGLDGGLNRFGYVGGNPLSLTDPLGLLILPSNPNGLPSDWVRDPAHRAPNGERYRHPSGDTLDWNPARPGEPGYQGKDHWHHNGGKYHHLPGAEVPDPQCPNEPSLFDRLKDYMNPAPKYDPRSDQWRPTPQRQPWLPIIPGRRLIPAR